jgi:hypothetical protein
LQRPELQRAAGTVGRFLEPNRQPQLRRRKPGVAAPHVAPPCDFGMYGAHRGRRQAESDQWAPLQAPHDGEHHQERGRAKRRPKMQKAGRETGPE